MTIGPDDTDPLSPSERQRMLERIDPDWTELEAEASDQSSDAVYLTTVEEGGTERRVVLKYPVLVDDERFRREAALLDHVAEHTSLPVPEVLGRVPEDGPTSPKTTPRLGTTTSPRTTSRRRISSWSTATASTPRSWTGTSRPTHGIGWPARPAATWRNFTTSGRWKGSAA